MLPDGVPLNDPFGGWVAWGKVPRESLASAELVRGGGATAWGNAALGGIVQLFTAGPGAGQEPSQSNLLGYSGRGSSGRTAMAAGAFDLRSVELAVRQPLGAGTLQLSGRDFATDGFPLVAPEDRGPADVAAWSRHRWLAGRWKTSLSAETGGSP